MTKRRQSSKDPVRSRNETTRILGLFDERFNQGGATVSGIAKELGIPTSTIYRWRQQRERAQLLKQFSPAHKRASISNCIKDACSENTTYPRYVSAMAFIAAWLRWPSNPELHAFGALAIAMGFVRSKTKAVYIDEIEANLREIFERFLRIDDILKVYSANSPVVPYMNEYHYGNIPYNDRDLVSEITNYLIAAPYEQAKPSTRPSLNKAFKMMEYGGFKYTLTLSRRSFEQLWISYAPAAPFLFVETYHSSLEWLVDPEAPDFVEAFEALVRDQDRVRLFFSQVKWAVALLRVRMDPRAVANITFPAFPEDLLATPVPIEGLSRRAGEVLRRIS